jgi:hypothetical protein
MTNHTPLLRDYNLKYARGTLGISAALVRESRYCPECLRYGKAIPRRDPCPFCVEREERKARA